MKEREIEQVLTGLIKRRGGLCLKFVSPARAGVPDRIVVTPRGRVIFIELKTLDGRLSKIQERQIARLIEHGAEVRVLHGLEAALKFVLEVFPD